MAYDRLAFYVIFGASDLGGPDPILRQVKFGLKCFYDLIERRNL